MWPLFLLLTFSAYGATSLTQIPVGSKITISKKLFFNSESSYPIITFQNRVAIPNDGADVNHSYCDIIDPRLRTRWVIPKNYTIKSIEVESEFKNEYYVTFYFSNSSLELTCYSDSQGSELTTDDFSQNYPAFISLKPILFIRRVESPSI